VGTKIHPLWPIQTITAAQIAFASTPSWRSDGMSNQVTDPPIKDPITSAVCITEFRIDTLSGNSVMVHPVEINANSDCL